MPPPSSSDDLIAIEAKAGQLAEIPSLLALILAANTLCSVFYNIDIVCAAKG